MQVHEWMTANPITVSSNATCSDAFRWMFLMELHALPVVDKKGQLVGIMTEKDLLCALPTSIALLSVYEIDSLFGEMKVEKVMTRRVISVSEDCALEKAARILVDNKIRSLPVTGGQKLVGIITRIDIFRVMMETMGGRSEGLRVTIQLREDKGELGSITDGIIHLGGKLVNLSTFWGDDPLKRKLTLKVRRINREELLLMLERNIGVQVIDYCESRAESEPHAISQATSLGVFPIQDLDAKVPWPVDRK